MKKSFSALLIIIALIVVIAFPVVNSYNNLVNLKQNADTAESNIDTMLQRRSDLIPSLVNTVKGYAAQEQEIFTEIADARSKLAGSTNVTDLADADNELSSALSRLLVIVEQYPDLKSNQNFQDLSIQLEGTENRIAIARQDYNTAVTEYNVKIKKFPSNIIAGIFNFEEKPLYKASSTASEPPVVDFSS